MKLKPAYCLVFGALMTVTAALLVWMAYRSVVDTWYLQQTLHYDVWMTPLGAQMALAAAVLAGVLSCCAAAAFVLAIRQLAQRRADRRLGTSPAGSGRPAETAKTAAV